jgi:CHAT domain-containing protein/Tfp pilus assembly protein PilF
MFSRSHRNRAILLSLLICGIPGCLQENPADTYAHAKAAFVKGDLFGSQQQAEREYERIRRSNPQWAWKFKILEAESMLWRGMYQDVLDALDSQPAGLSQKIQVLALRGAAQARLGQFSEAEESLRNANQLCAESSGLPCGEVSRAQGVLATERRQFTNAEHAFQQSLIAARTEHDELLEATAFLNLGAVALLEGHFDEAATWSQSAYQLSAKLSAEDVAQNALGNLGWASYRLGDNPRALNLFSEAIERAAQIGDASDEASWLTDAGYIYLDDNKLEVARDSFLRALDLERKVQSKDDIYNALRVLARLELQASDLDKAAQYAQQALDIARQSGNHMDELYPTLVDGQIAARRGQAKNAETTFRQVEQDKVCPAFLKWEAQHSLALLYQEEKRGKAANREYEAALATFETARANVHGEDFQLSFLTNAARIYDDYVAFLVAQGKIEEALRWADFNRARTLAEGLGLLTKQPAGTAAGSLNPPALNVRNLAAQTQGAILFYWLGEKQSFLWVIAKGKAKASLFPLPAAAEINARVEHYRKALTGPQDVLGNSNGEGRELYRMLVGPAAALIAGERKIFVIPDGSLNSLNFETLVVDGAKPHYWIEDADLVNASSLRVLAASLAASQKRHGRLLLIGNSIPASDDYPALPQAAGQMENVAKYFSGATEVYAREQATPAAYLASRPRQFSYIHFVAHGTASRLSPLDSAIILSRDATGGDSFKLYAREIIKHPLGAELVTISSCYGAGERAYSGEGLVGLAWAFLRAGAHYVVAALWEASDASTTELMDQFYRELNAGHSPDVALRDAKLALIHSPGIFRKPFYWAPFQLYTGRESAGRN